MTHPTFEQHLARLLIHPPDQGAPVPNLARYRKTIVAIFGVIAQALALGLLPAPADHWASVALALATALGVYATPNQPQP